MVLNKLAVTILKTARKVAREAGNEFYVFSRVDLQDAVLESGTGHANKAISKLVQAGLIYGKDGGFVITPDGWKYDL